MLTDATLEQILTRLPGLTLGVLGDLFLDRYLDLDAARTEVSIETGLDAYQVVRVRPYPGAAGTVINNLAALGVGRIHVVSYVGDDGEGHELRGALDALRVVDRSQVLPAPGWRTPTYTKPMLCEAGQPPRELNRLDIKNYTPLVEAAQDALLAALDETWPTVDALLVLDQVGGTGCGVITERVMERLGELGAAHPDKLILADSRDRIGYFRWVWLKPNQAECVRGVRAGQPGPDTPDVCAVELARVAGRPVFCTAGERGIWLADPRPGSERLRLVPAYPVAGPIDIVGAGDSTSAAIACAVAAGAELEAAAAFGNLVASITIQQIGTTGTASPAQVRRRWREVGHAAS